jgi:hypothetical protein
MSHKKPPPVRAKESVGTPPKLRASAIGEEESIAPAPPPSARRKWLVPGALSAVAASWIVYRILTFSPAPLDSPSTLRPVLYSWFAAFLKSYRSDSQARHAWSSWCLVLLTIPAILAILNYLASSGIVRLPRWASRLIASRTLLFAAIAASLLLSRFPALLAGELNVDETQFVASAHKLFKDPVFFRSVDCGTTGPLNILPLLLPAVFGVSPDYASGRLIALIIILASIFVMFRVYSKLTSDSVARIAILPMAGAFAVLRQTDFLQHSSEHVSILLLALAVYAAVTTFCKPELYAPNLVGLGLLLAAAFFAKMQAVPILLCVTAITLAWVHKHGPPAPFWRPYAMVGFGLAPLFLINWIVCLAAGVWNDFWMTYIVGNFSYIQNDDSLTPDMSRFGEFALGVPEIRWMAIAVAALAAARIFYAMRGTKAAGYSLFVQMTVSCGVVAALLEPQLRTGGGVVGAYGGALAIVMLGAAFVFLWQEPYSPNSAARWFGFAAWAILLAAAAAAYAPLNLFQHYLLLLIAPLCMTMAWPILAHFQRHGDLGPGAGERTADLAAASLPFVLTFVVLVLTSQIVQAGNPSAIDFAAVGPGIREPDSVFIESFTRPSDEISVWGWDARPYLGAGRTPATRDTNMSNFFVWNPKFQEYHNNRYLLDMSRHPAALFVDARENSRESPFSGRQDIAFESIPSIRSYIHANYVYLASAYGDRFFIRRDLARGVAGIPEPKPCDPHALRCFAASTGAALPVDLPPAQLPAHAVLEITFTPEALQEPLATVFGNDDGGVAEHRGFQLQAIAPDRYRVAIGVGSDWIFSHAFTLPERKPAALSVEFSGNTFALTLNGTYRDEIRLPQPMVNSTAPITLGSAPEHKHPFIGNIADFQLRDLGGTH